MRHRLISALVALFCLLIGLLAADALAQPLVVGSKSFSEQWILGEILAQWIEANRATLSPTLTVERRLNLGGTEMTHEALRAGEIDLYPEYTGTALADILKLPVDHDPATVYQMVRQAYRERYQLVWLPPLGFNNTYVLAVRQGDPQLSGVRTISDLRAFAGRLTLAFNHDFTDRPDGLARLRRLYGLDFADIKTMDPGLMYRAAAEHQVDAIVAFSTDARLARFGLRPLLDDRQAFPPYQAATVVRAETLRRYPALAQILNRLAGQIDDRTMRQLNEEVDVHGKSAPEVAHAFLVGRGLITSPGDAQAEAASDDHFATFAWHRRFYLAQLIGTHLFLTFIPLMLGILIAVPLAIVLTRLERLAGPVFGVLNVFQTIPSLALLGFLVPLLGIGIKPAILALLLYALLPLARNTYTGILGVEPGLIEASRGLGLTELQILIRVQIPLALPVIMAGIRTSAVILVGTATLASLIGAGGLGEPIFQGISSVQTNTILLGAVPAALLAIIIDRLLYGLEMLLVSPGLRLKPFR